MTTFTEDDCFALATVLDDWLMWNVPSGENDGDQTRYAHIQALRDRFAGSERSINPAACPHCRGLETVEEHGWVFARYRLLIDKRGVLAYPDGADMVQDVHRPCVSRPADLPCTATTLWCSRCKIDWWYLPPADGESGRFLRLFHPEA
jgi:hypothetical protein